VQSTPYVSKNPAINGRAKSAGGGQAFLKENPALKGGAKDEINLGLSRGVANYSSYRLLKWLRKAEKTR